MTSLSRRGAIKLASSFLASTPILMRAGRAQAAAEPGLVLLDMASFGGAGIDADTALAKAITAIEKVAADAGKGGEPVRIVLNLEKGASYRIKRPLAFKQLSGFELNGNGAELINTTRSQTLQISASNRVTIRDLRSVTLYTRHRRCLRQDGAADHRQGRSFLSRRCAVPGFPDRRLFSR